MKPGRKRSFDKEEALNTAMKIFWKSGYSGTSLSDLTASLKINKPSLYATFGNKEQLFKSALNHYQKAYSEPIYATLSEPKSKPFAIRLGTFLHSIAEVISDPNRPIGCLYVNSSCESGAKNMTSDILETLHTIKGDTLQYFIDVFKEEMRLGNLPDKADAVAMSTYLMTILYGMGVLAKNGSTLKELEPVVSMTVNSLLPE